EERYISPEAYAHYAQAALDEAGGDDAGAALEYARAAEEDPDSADIMTRLGRVHCRLKSGKHVVFFERAEELDAEFAPLYRERALCALREGNPTAAHDAATKAVVLDPDDEAASLALSEAARRLGHADEASRWLLALVLRDPGSSRARAAYENLNKKADAHD